jgi:hypothetical protein
MTQHTPGPWVISARYAERDGIQIWDTVHGWIIADVVNDQHDNSQANADLIAAAPATLGALQRAAQWLEMAYTVTLDEAYAVESRKAKTAIAAAEGIGECKAGKYAFACWCGGGESPREHA